MTTLGKEWSLQFKRDSTYNDKLFAKLKKRLGGG
jgi:hypothetical protein